ncbi:hypothetical protein IXO390_19475 [Xanthomonas oryzae pv. oryzae]|nr:hypothetical protein IXO390_19475 [Xanthomonas oryzae pv. oryzae]
MVALDARLALQLPMQQINFFEVATGFFRFHDQHDKARFQCTTDALHVVCAIPLVTRLPAVYSLRVLADGLRNFGHAPSHPVQELGLSAGVHRELGGNALHADQGAAHLLIPTVERRVTTLFTRWFRCCAVRRV